jgi:hypothetical protein
LSIVFRKKSENWGAYFEKPSVIHFLPKFHIRKPRNIPQARLSDVLCTTVPSLPPLSISFATGELEG